MGTNLWWLCSASAACRTAPYHCLHKSSTRGRACCCCALGHGILNTGAMVSYLESLGDETDLHACLKDVCVQAA